MRQLCSLIRHLALSAFATIGCFETPVRAEQDAAAEVRQASTAYVTALGHGDANSIAEFWTEDGIYIDADGNSVAARVLAREEFAAGSPPGASLAPAPTSIHFVEPTVAIEQPISERATSADSSRPTASFIAVWVKRGERWKLSLLREFVTSPRSVAQAASPLAKLDGMAGRWTASHEGRDVQLTCEWTPDKSYLVQQFAAKQDAQVVRQGTQRIAWDAAAEQVRSWTFNADGSFSEAHWRQEGDVWVATSTGVAADGRRLKSVHFWTLQGDDVCWFKSVHGEVDGQPVNDLVLKFTRSRE